MSSSVGFLSLAAIAFSVQVWLPGVAAFESSQDVKAMFAASSDVTVTSSGMMVTAPQVQTIMLVKRDDDGSLVTKCETTAEGAESFLRPKTRIIDSTKPQEK
jgi:hypothetical protein